MDSSYGSDQDKPFAMLNVRSLTSRTRSRQSAFGPLQSLKDRVQNSCFWRKAAVELRPVLTYSGRMASPKRIKEISAQACSAFKRAPDGIRAKDPPV
ncbi:hypothetical protein ACFX5Q_26730 [Mesorhizobium sp. IMUNJ 23033]|uniref:hypothetical protein n=1 Tax=Mesorhizobium sp. IMUNJ 23033 TaxID=3378039 RepID=UPI00384EDB77